MLILKAVTNPGTASWAVLDADEVVVDPTGLTYVAATEAQGAISELDAAIAAPGMPELDGLIFDPESGDALVGEMSVGQAGIWVDDGTYSPLRQANTPYYGEPNGLGGYSLSVPLIGMNVLAYNLPSGGMPVEITLARGTQFLQLELTPVGGSRMVDITLPPANETQGMALYVSFGINNAGDGKGSCTLGAAIGDFIEYTSAYVVPWGSIVGLVSNGVDNWMVLRPAVVYSLQRDITPVPNGVATVVGFFPFPQDSPAPLRLIGVKVMMVTPNAVGTFVFDLQLTGLGSILAAPFDMNTLVGSTPTNVPLLTGVNIDWRLVDAVSVWTATFTSNNLGFNGSTVILELQLG